MIDIHAAVCDDESAARSIVSGAFSSVFAQHGVKLVPTECRSVIELESLNILPQLELVILDIDMPGMNGVDFGQKLRAQHNDVEIIYVTNREDRVFDSLKVNPVGFVRKSHLLEDIPTVVEAFLARQEKQGLNKNLIVELRDRVFSIPIRSIIYIEGSRNCQLLHVENQSEPIPVRRNLQSLEDSLAPHGFLRIHKGFLVNFEFIRLIEEAEVQLTNGERIPLSRRKVQEIKLRFLQLMRADGAL